MSGVYTEWSQKQNPSMSYVLNTYHRRCDRDKLIMMFLTTETSRLYGTAAYDESKTQVRYYQQNIKPSKEFTLFYFISFFAIRSDIS